MKKATEIHQNKAVHVSDAPAGYQAPEDPVIEIKNIDVHFGGKKILSDFSLTLFSGERLVLTGPSGAGKSTLAQCILGFERPQRGHLRICGTRLKPETIWQLRRKIAYVPQEPEPGPGTLFQWLCRPFSFQANRKYNKNIEKIPDMAACLGLSPELLDTEAFRLSGGEKQRAAILAAVLLGRDIILADEPTSALDRGTARQVGKYLHNLPGISSLIISHDDQIAGMADRVVRINQ